MGTLAEYSFGAFEEFVKLIERLINLINEKAPEGNERLEPSKLIDLIKVDFYKFLSYYSVCDSKISAADASYISQLFGTSLSPAELKNFIQENNIYSESFEQTIPAALKVLVDTDNFLYQAGNKNNGKLHLIYLKVLMACAFAMDEENGKSKEEIERISGENSDLGKYVSRLLKYCEQNNLEYQEDIEVDFSKCMDVTNPCNDDNNLKEEFEAAEVDEQYILTDEEYDLKKAELLEVVNESNYYWEEILRYKKLFEVASEYLTSDEQEHARKMRVRKNLFLLNHIYELKERENEIRRMLVLSGRGRTQIHSRRPLSVRIIKRNNKVLTLDDSIDELNLRFGIWKVLHNRCFDTIRDVCSEKIYDPIIKKGIGEGGMRNLIDTLDVYGFKLSSSN